MKRRTSRIPEPPARTIDWPLWENLLQLCPGDREQCDIHVAYTGTPTLSLCGFLITARGDLDHLIAFCPLSSARRGGTSTCDLLRQLKIAVRLARHPDSAATAVDAIELLTAGTEARPVPHWIYGLSCAPLTRHWDGVLLHPRPFCPVMFNSMAHRPEAARWLQRQHPRTI
jgi:hypothetical protein